MGENSVKHVLWILCAVILAADNCFCFDFSVFAVLPSLQLNLFVNELVFSKTISRSLFPSFSLSLGFQFSQQDFYQSLYRFYENCFVLCFECLKIYLTNFSFVWYHNNCIYSSISSPHSNQTKWVTTVLQTSLNTFPMLKLQKSKPQQKHFYVFPVIYTNIYGYVLNRIVALKSSRTSNWFYLKRNNKSMPQTLWSNIVLDLFNWFRWMKFRHFSIYILRFCTGQE